MEPYEAREIAAQAWCDNSTSHLDMIPELAEAFAKILVEEVGKASHEGGQVMSEYQPGIGCQCCAHSENECCCPDVDWRSAREVELEALVEKLEQQLATPALNETKGNK